MDEGVSVGFGILLVVFAAFIGGVAGYALQTRFSGVTSDFGGGLEDPVVLFRSDGLFERQLGFEFPSLNQSVVCNISRRDEVQIARRTYLYVNSTRCSVVEPGLVSRWDNTSFTDIYVYDRMKEMAVNRSQN